MSLAAAKSSAYLSAPDCQPLPELTVLRLIARAQNGDAAARERVILSFTPLAIHVAARVASKSKQTPGGPELADMIQEALAAISRGVDAIDLTRAGSVAAFFGVAAERAAIALARRSTYAVHYPRRSDTFRMPDALPEISLNADSRPDAHENDAAPLADQISDQQLTSPGESVCTSAKESVVLRLILCDGERVDALASSKSTRADLAQIAREALASFDCELSMDLPAFTVSAADLVFFERYRAQRAPTQLFSKLTFVDRLAPETAAERARVAGDPSALVLRLATQHHRWAAECSAPASEMIHRLHVVRDLAVVRLDQDAQRLIALRHFGGLNVSQIARMLKIPRARARDQVAAAAAALTTQENLIFDLLAG